MSFLPVACVGRTVVGSFGLLSLRDSPADLIQCFQDGIHHNDSAKGSRFGWLKIQRPQRLRDNEVTAVNAHDVESVLRFDQDWRQDLCRWAGQFGWQKIRIEPSQTPKQGVRRNRTLCQGPCNQGQSWILLCSAHNTLQGKTRDISILERVRLDAVPQLHVSARLMGLHHALEFSWIEHWVPQHETLGLRNLHCMEHGAQSQRGLALAVQSV